MIVLQLDHFAFPGYGNQVSYCDLLVYTAEEIAIATELKDNPGASITNRADVLATQIVRNLDMNPNKFMLIEHYDARSYGDPNEAERFALVTFTWNKAAERFESPNWVHIDRDYLLTILPSFQSGPPVVIPPAHRRRPGAPPAPST